MLVKALCIGSGLEFLRTCIDDDASITFARGAFEALGLLRSESFDVLIAKLPVPGVALRKLCSRNHIESGAPSASCSATLRSTPNAPCVWFAPVHSM